MQIFVAEWKQLYILSLSLPPNFWIITSYTQQQQQKTVNIILHILNGHTDR